MKVFISLICLFALASCGKKIADRAQTKSSNPQKSKLSTGETWTILSERPLPSKVLVVINGMEFFDECKGIGQAEVDRTYRNGTINIPSYSAFRQDFFDVDIYDCTNGSVYFTQDYVDQTVIDHPRGAPVRVVLRLRNR